MKAIMRQDHRAAGLFGLLFLWIFVAVAPAQNTPTITWTGAENANWSNPLNWSPARVPDATDHVAITSGSNVTLNVSASIASLQLGLDSGSSTQRLTFGGNHTLTLGTNSTVGSRGELYFRGALNGAGRLEVRGFMQWRTGRVAAGLTIAETGRLNFTGEYYPLLSSGDDASPVILTNRGTVTYVGGYELYAGANAQIHNHGVWRLDADGDALNHSEGSAPYFHNYGTLTKAGGTGATTFRNSTTTLHGGGTVDASTGVLQFVSTTLWNNGSRVTGGGVVRLNGGVTTLSGTNHLEGNWEWFNASIYGNGVIAGPVPLVWRTGNVYGGLTVAPGAQLRFTGEYYPRLSSLDDNNPAYLTNRGTVYYVGGYELYAGAKAEVHNHGTWRLEADGTAFQHSTGSPPSFHNHGTLTKTGGTGATAFYNSTVYLNGGGVVNAASGVLRLSATTEWRNGNRITGAGIVRLHGSIATLSGTNILDGNWEWFDSYVHGNGVLAGPKPLVWRTGQMRGALTVAPGSTLQFTGEYYPAILSYDTNVTAVLTNRGTVVYPGGYPLYAGTASQIYNHGQWRIEADGSVFEHGVTGDWPTFHNHGLITKVGGTGDSSFSQSTTVLYGDGTVNASIGSLRFTSNTDWRNGNRITGSGTVRLLNGSTTLSGTNLLDGNWEWFNVLIYGNGVIAGPRPLVWRTGQMRGALTVAPDAALRFTGEYYPALISYDTNVTAVLTNRGTVSYVGGYPLYGGNGSQVHNFGQWRAENDGTVFEHGITGDWPTFHNHGTIAKVAGTGLSTFNQSLVKNHGSIRPTIGELNFLNTLDNSAGAFHFVLGQSNGAVRVNGSWPLQGTLRITTTNGFVPDMATTLDLVRGNGGLYGNFSSLDLAATPPDLGWTVDYSPSLVRLRATDACIAGGLVGWWSADGGPGDLTGSFNGTLANGASTTNGYVGQAFAVDGVNDVVALPNGWNPGTRWTLQAWVNVSQILAGRRNIFGGLDDCRDWALSAFDGHLGVTYRQPGGCTATLSNATPALLNTWYHLAATCNGTNVALYINGTLVGTAASEPNYTGAPNSIGIGGRPGYPAESFAGLVDEATVHNRPLTGSEIATTYANGTAGRCAQLGLGILSFSPLGLVNTDVAQFTVRFNQPFQTNTFTTADLQMTGPGGAIPNTGVNIAPAVPADGRTFLVNLPALTADGVYSVSVGPDILSLSGASMTGGVFTAGFTIDQTGPRVTSFSPASPLSNQVSSVEATFSEAILAGSVQAGDLVLTGPGDPVATGVTQLSSNVWRFILNKVLGSGDYTLRLGPGITDFAGNSMDQDQDDVRGEATEDQFVVTLQSYNPDLHPLILSSPALAQAGQGANFAYAVTNLGAAPAPGGWRSQFWMALTADGSNATLLGSVTITNPLLVNASLNFTQSVVLPSGLAGTRFLGVKLDTLNQVAESDESNNVAWASIGTVVSAPDLVATNLSVPANAQFGSTITVDWKRRNIGSAATFTAGQDRVFLSSTANSIAGARLLATVQGAVLGAGAETNRSQSIAIPLETSLPPGNYFLVVAVDSPDSQPESNEGNNLASVAITLASPPLPDLAIHQFSPPTLLVPGVAMQTSWTTTNSGTAALTNGIWRERIHFTNAVSGRLTLGEWTFTNDLALGASQVRTQFVQIPANLAAEPGWLTLAVDVFDEVVEVSESNNLAISETQLPVSRRLFLELSAGELVEGGAPILGRVRRNGGTNEAAVVALTNNAPSRLAMTNAVTIPVGAYEAAFAVSLPTNGVIDGSATAILSASATNYAFDAASVGLVDDAVPALTLVLSTNRLREGLTQPATLFVSQVNTAAVTVLLAVDDPLSLAVPASVEVPANQLSVVFTVLAPNDAFINGARTNAIRAVAGGYSPAAAPLTVLDDDLPTVTLALSPSAVSENAGPQAASLNIQLASPASRALVVELESSNPALAKVPLQLTVPAGQSAASVPVAVIDNQSLGSNAPVLFQGYLRESGSDPILGTTPLVSLAVLDDESPALTLKLDKDLVGEGLVAAAKGTVSRNSGIASALTVNLASSDTSEITVPASVVIPAGQVSAQFDLSSVQDNTTDGSQSATITASASGFTSGTAQLTVSDADLPDLRVVTINGPTTGEAESQFTMNYRVANQGRVAAASNLLTKVYLRSDPQAFGGTLLTSYTLSGALPAGQFFEQSLSGRLPANIGKCYLVVVTDADGKNTETLEENNLLVSAPIEVLPAFTATVAAAVDTAVAGTPIQLTGSATRGGGGPAANTLVGIQVVHDGLRRNIAALTDGSGNFTATFYPLPGEAGFYGVGAGHPGLAEQSVQDTFTLLGMAIKPGTVRHEIVENAIASGSLTVSNLSNIALSGLAAEVVQKPDGWTVDLVLTNSSLPGNGSVPLGYVVTPNSSGIATIVVRVTAEGGVETHAVLTVAAEPLRSRLVAAPTRLFAGMLRGEQTILQFSVANLGGLATGPVSVSLPSLPWLSLASVSPMPALAPGETNTVTLILSPAPDLELTTYEGALLVQAGDSAVNVPFEFRALSDAKGDLLVSVVDEFTYYAEGAPKVTNATVIVRDVITHEAVTNGVTGASGTVFFGGLPEGFYEVYVTADQHASFTGNTFVSAGKTNDFEPFISRTVVEYIWSVVPTEIEDRTTIKIETIFETVVPVPVVTMEPAFIDLADLTEPEAQVEVRITNHGLVAAKAVSLELPVGGPVTFETVATELGDLPAMSSITVPIRIRFPEAAPTPSAMSLTDLRRQTSGSRNQCYYTIRKRHELPCGNTTNVYYSSTSVRDSKATGCGGGGGSSGSRYLGNGPIFNGGPLGAYGASSGPGGTWSAPRSIKEKEECGCEGFVPACFELGGSLAAPPISIGGKEASVKLTGSGKVCTCCDEDGPGIKKEISAGVEGSMEFTVPLTAPDPVVEMTDGVHTFKGGVHLGGVTLTVSPKISGTFQYTEDCHGKNAKTCITIAGAGAGEVKAELGPEFEVSQAGVAVGKVTAKASVFIKSGVSLKYVQCGDTSETKLCFDGVTAGVSVTAAFGPAEVSQSSSLELAGEKCTGGAGGSSLTFSNEDEILRELERQLQPQLEKMANEIRARHGIAPRTTQTTSSSSRNVAPMDFRRQSAGDGICARVKLLIEQDLVMTRNAFDAKLELINRDPGLGLSAIGVGVVAYDADGKDVTERFGMRKPVVIGMGDVDGTGTLGPDSRGTASFILVPTREAAPEGPTVYFVGGYLRYKLGEQSLDIPLTPVPITVYPDPRLVVKYFHQRDVFSDDPFTRDVIEPTIPYSLAVMVQNKGKGEAKNVRIISGQPRIIENERGLLIDFKIIATEVAGQSLTPSLTANFGLINPGDIAIGRWLMTSTLQGLFINYSATFEHQDSLGKTNLSLIDEVTIHEMNRLVQAGGAFEDGKPDFLVNGEYDIDDMPDHLYLSDGTTNRVSVVRAGTIDAPASAGHLEVQLNAEMPAGWTYLRIADPANGHWQLTRVVRSDGFELSVGTNVWTTDRTFIGRTQKPVRENILHLLDHNSSGRYTLIYSPLPPDDFTTPSSAVASLPAYSQEQIPVTWSGTDAGGGVVASYDIYVAENYGPFTPWLQGVAENAAIFAGTAGKRYEFYSVATDNSGNREAAPLYADTHTVVTLTNTAPTLSLNAPAEVDEGSLVTITANAVEPDAPLQSLLFTLAAGPAGATINPGSGQITWPTSEGTGPSTNLFRVVARDNGLPPLSATSSVTVVVREVNQRPVLPALPDFQISEGRLFRYTNSATDADLPLQTLTYSLGAGSPAGLSVSSSGVLSWTPTSTQGGRTNAIQLIVQDSGAPSLSATQMFRIYVRDNTGDFIVTVGKTNLLAGNPGHVPVRMNSGLDLVNVTFDLDADPSRLDSLTLVPLASGLNSATLTPAGNGRSRLELSANANAPLNGQFDAARLHFYAVDEPRSAIVPLHVGNVQGVKLGGEAVTNAVGIDGRVIVVAAEPVLEATGVRTNRVVEVYGRPLVRYELLSSPTVTGPWQPGLQWDSTNISPARIPITDTNTLFFQARQIAP